jgi:S-adenosylmethionine:tRNA ribosyltransferase-isomerase
MQNELNDFDYELPSANIAIYPLSERDQSKLLFYEKGNIRHKSFKDITNIIPERSVLFFNNTRVLSARLLFRKKTGALLEIFPIKPVEPVTQIEVAINAREMVVFECLIGNVKRWKSDEVLSWQLNGASSVSGTLTVKLKNPEKNLVEFRWNTGETFGELLEKLGETPLPPYLNRNAETIDKERYQTIYSSRSGAVAAPTAGLHFTEPILQQLKEHEHTIDFLTLHVSAGTFLPVKTENIIEHPMHAEQLLVSRKAVENLINNPFVVSVGTTAMRTLESLYWYGVKLLNGESGFYIPKLFPYEQSKNLPELNIIWERILQEMDDLNIDEVNGITEIFIFPGYKFQVCKGLITNFHQPKSTLLMLIAAFIGENWKKVYQEAVSQNYRFLSYGDSSFLIP